MNLMTVFSVVLIGVIASVVLRAATPEYASAVCILAGILTILVLLPQMSDLLDFTREFMTVSGFTPDASAVVLKAIGTGYLAQFVCELCESVGAQSLASKVELAEKIYVVLLSIPLLKDLLELAQKAVTM